MDQCTHEVRAEYWKKIIQACGQRPAGQSAKSWMDENGICEQSYYHWQRRFRKQAYEEMKGNATVPAVAEKTELTFVEIPCHTSAETNTYMVEYSCAMKSHFRKFGNQMSGSGNHLCEFTRVMFYLDRISRAWICHV